MSHCTPEVFVKMDNFYTVVMHEKGAEIRVYHTYWAKRASGECARTTVTQVVRTVMLMYKCRLADSCIWCACQHGLQHTKLRKPWLCLLSCAPSH